MIRVAWRSADGGNVLLIGLTPENIARLTTGGNASSGSMPILAEFGTPPQPGGPLTVLIVYGATERQLTAELKAIGIPLPPDLEEQVRAIEREHRRKGTTP